MESKRAKLGNIIGIHKWFTIANKKLPKGAFSPPIPHNGAKRHRQPQFFKIQSIAYFNYNNVKTY